MNSPQDLPKRVTDEEVVERARRAMVRASDKAMEDYRRFGIEPVLGPAALKNQETEKP